MTCGDIFLVELTAVLYGNVSLALEVFKVAY